MYILLCTKFLSNFSFSGITLPYFGCSSQVEDLTMKSSIQSHQHIFTWKWKFLSIIIKILTPDNAPSNDIKIFCQDSERFYPITSRYFSMKIKFLSNIIKILTADNDKFHPMASGYFNKRNIFLSRMLS